MSKQSPGTNSTYSHDELAKMLVDVKIPGDVALSICNAFTYANEHKLWDQILFCEHAYNGVIDLVNEITDRLEVSHEASDRNYNDK